VLNLIPSPHISVQVSGEELDPPVHVYPISIVHVLEHPSPSITLLSSHTSSPIFIPSPQIGLHTSGLVLSPPEHVKPVSNCQVLDHPSLSLVFPSSQ